MYKFEFLMLHTVIWSRLIDRFLLKKRKNNKSWYFTLVQIKESSKAILEFCLTFRWLKLTYNISFTADKFLQSYNSLVLSNAFFFNRGSLISFAQWSTSFRFRGTSSYSFFPLLLINSLFACLDKWFSSRW